MQDNPALQAALEDSSTLIPVYIHETTQHDWSDGAASRWWLHHSLSALQNSLREHGSDLFIFSGQAEQVLARIAESMAVSRVYWNRVYEPHAIERDQQIKQNLKKKGLTCKSYNSALLTEPWDSVKADGTPYRVFTPFWKALLKRGVTLYSSSPPQQFPPVSNKLTSRKLSELHLLPKIRWDDGLASSWSPGESDAIGQLQQFIEDGVQNYPTDRDIPATSGTSRLSPHLHFGEISPCRIWQEIQQWSDQHAGGGRIRAAEAYLRQLGWRDFAYHLLYHFPHTTDKPLDPRFSDFPWKTRQARILKIWQQGRTGIPIVDAGMRELWHSGWMHNRVRMIAASLLTKNLLIPWQKGARWFWDTLVDADLANNTLGWQWTAGCGADAAPFFRIFNPVRQGERFDPQGDYVRYWVPELKSLPAKWIHQPWEAPQQVLDEAGVVLGKHYPEPIVDLADSRARALSIWDDLKAVSRE